MKKLLPLLFCLYALNSFAQEKIYYDSNMVVTNVASARVYTLTVKFEGKDSSGPALEKTFFLSGQISTEIHYSNYKRGTVSGTFKRWRQTGQLWRDAHYSNNAFNGELITYWPNGKVKRHDNYLNDSLLNGKCFDINGKDTAWYPFRKAPSFPGGKNALVDFIQRSVKYPPEAQEMNEQGEIEILFLVNKDGSLSQLEAFDSKNNPIKETTGVNNLFKEEGFRVVRSMPKWICGKLDGDPWEMYSGCPFTFKLQ